MVEVKHSRPDGTFVIERDGQPYHVTPDDPLFAEAQAAAEGLDLPPEPPPPVPSVPPPAPQPTRAALMARLLQIQAQIEALPA